MIYDAITEHSSTIHSKSTHAENLINWSQFKFPRRPLQLYRVYTELIMSRSSGYGMGPKCVCTLYWNLAVLYVRTRPRECEWGGVGRSGSFVKRMGCSAARYLALFIGCLF